MLHEIWDGTGIGKYILPLRQTQIGLFCILSIMAAGGVMTQAANEPVAMVLT